MAQYPAFCTIQQWIDISGIGRSKTYELIASGKLTARKLGSRTLVDVQQGLAYLNALPALPAQSAAA